MTSSGPSAPPDPVVVMYSGWQVWDGHYGSVRVGGDFEASLEFVERSTPSVVEPSTTVDLRRTGANWYDATARVLDTADAVVLDLGPFRALRWVRPGEGAGAFAAGDVVSLELSLNLNAWPDAPWANRAQERFGTGHRWQVQRILRLTNGLDDVTEIDEAAMETVDSAHQYCLLHCTLVR